MIRNPVFEGRPNCLQTDIDAFTTDPGLKGIFLSLESTQEWNEETAVTYTRLLKHC